MLCMRRFEAVGPQLWPYSIRSLRTVFRIPSNIRRGTRRTRRSASGNSARTPSTDLIRSPQRTIGKIGRPAGHTVDLSAKTESLAASLPPDQTRTGRLIFEQQAVSTGVNPPVERIEKGLHQPNSRLEFELNPGG